MGHNLAQLDEEEKNRINLDLRAAAIAYQERYGIPVNPGLIEQSLPPAERPRFNQRLNDFRQRSKQLSRLAWKAKNK